MAKPDSATLRAIYEKHHGNNVRIARELGVARSTADSWCLELGLKAQGKGGIQSSAPSEDTMRDLYQRFGGNIRRLAVHLGVKANTVQNWYSKIGLRGQGREQYSSLYPQQIEETLQDGFAIAFSDAHFWFDKKSRAHEALLVAARKLKPHIVVANGDLIDGARISRHDPSGIDLTPTLNEELEVTKRHMAEIAKSCGSARRYFTLGNHDSRLSRYIAQHAPELDDVDGSRLDHHILGWDFCMSVTVNRDVVIKHAFRGGIHATYNNTLHDGRTIVTGHLHAQQARPFTDAHGTRWGVDLGCLADPTWPQFNYTTANTKNWRSGFAVLEFRAGRLLPPMLASVTDWGDVVLQRNEVLLRAS